MYGVVLVHFVLSRRFWGMFKCQWKEPGEREGEVGNVGESGQRQGQKPVREEETQSTVGALACWP